MTKTKVSVADVQLAVGVGNYLVEAMANEVKAQKEFDKKINIMMWRDRFR